MKSEKFSNALGEIDISYVEEVVNYNAVHKQKRPIWKIVAACVAIVMLIGIIPLWNSGNKASQGFVLVAYASENNIIIELYDEINTKVGQLSNESNYFDKIFSEGIIKYICNKNNINNEFGLSIFN